MICLNMHKRHLSLIKEGKDEKLREYIEEILPINKRFKIEEEKKSISGSSLFEEILNLKDKINKIKTIDGKRYKYEFSEDQNEFLNEFIKASLTKIYKQNELLKDLDKLQQRFNFSVIHQFVLLTAPRKVGKTFIIAVYMTILLYLYPNVKISIFSPGQNSSGRILEEAKPILKDLDIKLTQETAKKSIEVMDKWECYGRSEAHPNNAKIGVMFFFILFFFIF